MIQRDRRDAALIGWLRALPEETIGRSPVLSTFRGWVALVAGDGAAIHVEVTLETAPSALWDAVVVPMDAAFDAATTPSAYIL